MHIHELCMRFYSTSGVFDLYGCSGTMWLTLYVTATVTATVTVTVPVPVPVQEVAPCSHLIISHTQLAAQCCMLVYCKDSAKPCNPYKVATIILFSLTIRCKHKHMTSPTKNQLRLKVGNGGITLENQHLRYFHTTLECAVWEFTVCELCDLKFQFYITTDWLKLTTNLYTARA